MDFDRLKSIALQADDMIGKNGSHFTKRNIKRFIETKRLSVDPVFWSSGVLSWALQSFQEEYGAPSNWFRNNLKLTGGKHKAVQVDNTPYFYGNYSSLDHAQKNIVFSFLSQCSRDSNGSILYRESLSATFLDTLGMVTPFLARYGAETGNMGAIRLGLTQFQAFFSEGMDERTGLPYHGYDEPLQVKCGVIGWGRGVGWLLLGLAEFLVHCPDGTPERAEAREYFLRMVNTVMQYQRPDGGFSWQLQALEGPADTSVTSMVGHSLARYNAVEAKSLYEAELHAMEESLLDSVLGNGLVTGSSAECIGFSMYPQVFESNSWGQGFGLLFLLEMARVRRQTSGRVGP